MAKKWKKNGKKWKKWKKWKKMEKAGPWEWKPVGGGGRRVFFKWALLVAEKLGNAPGSSVARTALPPKRPGFHWASHGLAPSPPCALFQGILLFCHYVCCAPHCHLRPEPSPTAYPLLSHRFPQDFRMRSEECQPSYTQALESALAFLVSLSLSTEPLLQGIHKPSLRQPKCRPEMRNTFTHVFTLCVRDPLMPGPHPSGRSLSAWCPHVWPIGISTDQSCFSAVLQCS